jgi:hypothetical protein
MPPNITLKLHEFTEKMIIFCKLMDKLIILL